MSTVLPFLTRSSAEDISQWVNALQSAMPNERIVAFDELTNDERNSATVAIVANPEPQQLEQLPALRWVHSVWAGVERLLGEYRNQSVAIVRLEDPQLAATMAEAVLAWTLYLHREMPAYAAQQRAREWRQRPLRLPHERCIALLGLGNLGRRAAHALKSAGFNVIGWSRSATTIDGVETFAGDNALANVLARADIAVCLLPLTEQTRGLLNAKRFSQMKPVASLINFGRGAVVNIDDLLDALNRNALSHAVLDVFDVEPLPSESPLWTHRSVTVLPHISAPTHKPSAAAIVAKNIAAYRANGVIPKAVDRGLGY
ncbi:MAG: 2-hydroxyacid dehydrogenase [Casimicrobium sp.]